MGAGVEEHGFLDAGEVDEEFADEVIVAVAAAYADIQARSVSGLRTC